MKNNNNFLLILFLLFLLISCGNDDSPVNESEVVSPQTKDISFSFDVVEISNKDAHKNKGVNEALLNKVIVDAASVVITIQDESNTIIYNREKLDLNNENDIYISSSISLDFGNYTIIEFMVLDAQDNAIYITPKVGSDIAPNVTKALPISLIVGASTGEQISLKVLDTNNLTAEDFGYTNFDFTILGEFTFVIDQTDELSNLTLTIWSNSDHEYLIDWGDEIEENYIPGSEVQHDYSEQGKYTVNVKGNVSTLNSLMIFNKGLVEIDFSKLVSLENVLLIDSQLTSLDVSSNKLLEELSLTNYIVDNQITNIDISSNIFLKTLILNNNQLSNIDLSANSQLERLSLENNQLTNIDLSHNLGLKELRLSNNPQLTSLDISSHTKLKYLSLDYMSQLNLGNMNLSIYPELSQLSLRGNELTSIDLSKNLKLTALFLTQNQLTSIDLTSNTELVYFYLDFNKLKSLDLSSNDKLEVMDISSNLIETLDLSNNPMLYGIQILDNQISDIETMESIYSQVLANVKANNVSNGFLLSQKNNYIPSQALIDVANELIVDHDWQVFY